MIRDTGNGVKWRTKTAYSYRHAHHYDDLNLKRISKSVGTLGQRSETGSIYIQNEFEQWSRLALKQD